MTLQTALKVECYLDAIRDPAEREIAVECLMVIYKMSERNPEIRITKKDVNLLQIMQDAVSLFWSHWISHQSPSAISLFIVESNHKGAPELAHRRVKSTEPSGTNSPRASRVSRSTAPNDLTFEKNEKLARRLFYDLPQDGHHGTMSYLARSCLALCFDVSWSG